MSEEKPAASTMKRVKALLEELQALREKETALIEEINLQLGGGVGIGQKMRAARADFEDAWALRYRTPYQWQHTKDAPNLKRLVLALGPEEFRARAGRYVKDEDPWLLKNRHPFGVFVSSINRYVVEQPIAQGTFGGSLDELEEDAARTAAALRR